MNHCQARRLFQYNSALVVSTFAAGDPLARGNGAAPSLVFQCSLMCAFETAVGNSTLGILQPATFHGMLLTAHANARCLPSVWAADAAMWRAERRIDIKYCCVHRKRNRSRSTVRRPASAAFGGGRGGRTYGRRGRHGISQRKRQPIYWQCRAAGPGGIGLFGSGSMRQRIADGQPCIAGAATASWRHWQQWPAAPRRHCLSQQPAAAGRHRLWPTFLCVAVPSAGRVSVGGCFCGRC